MGLLFFIVYTADVWCNLENHLVAYAGDATIYAFLNSPSDRIAVTESLNRDLLRIEPWCRDWGMKLNPLMFQSMSASRSRTDDPLHLPLYIGGSPILITK